MFEIEVEAEGRQIPFGIHERDPHPEKADNTDGEEGI